MVKHIIVLILSIVLFGCNDNERETIKTENIDVLINAKGELESSLTAMVAPPSVSNMWQYKIKQLLPENTSVKKGDIVVSFDDKRVRERLIDKQAELKQANKELENKKVAEKEKSQELTLNLAQMKMEFDKAKRKAEIVDQSRSDIERKKMAIDFTIAENDLFLANEKLNFQISNTKRNLQLSYSKVERLKNEVFELEREISSLQVKARIDGVVIYEPNWEGEKPAVGENIQFGQTVVKLAVIDKMQVKVQIEEPDSGKVKLGQSVNIFLDGKQDNVASGKVTRLGSIFRNKSYQDKRRIVDVIVAFDNVDVQRMRPGMSARVEIISERFENVLTIPKEALTTVDNNSKILIKTTFGHYEVDVNVSKIVGNKAIIFTTADIKGKEFVL